MITKPELMICTECGKERLKTDSRVCLICAPTISRGVEVEQKGSLYRNGKEIQSKTGHTKTQENAWMG